MFILYLLTDEETDDHTLKLRGRITNESGPFAFGFRSMIQVDGFTYGPRVILRSLPKREQVREAGSIRDISEFEMPAITISRIVHIKKPAAIRGTKAVIPAEQDGCATESMGPIYDRTQEHLGYSDKTIIALRRVLLQAVKSVRREGSLRI